jgi:hypothetical protein
MKVAAAYNVFDGSELLPQSIDCIRAVADVVIVVYQTKSNYGNYLGFDLKARLEAMDIDVLYHYEPVAGTGAFNECNKRNVGRILAEQQGADVFITVDCDELYNKQQLRDALAAFVASGKDASACQMQTYYKTSDYRYATPEEYYVPLFYKLGMNRVFKEYTQWPVLADPTRKLASNNVLVFSREQIEMHHLSYVRDDIRMKLVNSSALKNHAHKVDEIVNRYQSWKAGEPALTVHGETPLIYAPFSAGM